MKALEPGWVEALGRAQPSGKTAAEPREGQAPGEARPKRRSQTTAAHKESCSRGGKKGSPKRHAKKPPPVPEEDSA